MFIYFNQYKANYRKGQLAPFFIAFIILLLVAALVAVNIGKIGIFKTYTSNAADAGALAAGSVMASVFNGQAVMNSEMIVATHNFLASMGVVTALIIANAWAAVGGCAAIPCCSCPGGCCCVCCCGSTPCGNRVKDTIAALKGAIVAVVAFHAAQYYFYRTIKQSAMEGREYAIEAGYRYAFLNSGIGNALISGEVPSDPQEQEGDDNNYSDTFGDWIKTPAVTSGSYRWVDGDDRDHEVRVSVATESINDYEMRRPVLPTAAIFALYYQAIGTISAASWACGCCPAATGVLSAAAASVSWAVLAAMAGLAPAWSIKASGLADLAFLMYWIDDIDHDRKVTLNVWQEHEGRDYGVMGQAQYPITHSYSLVDFEGEGEIYHPNPKFDAGIIATDILEGE